MAIEVENRGEEYEQFRLDDDTIIFIDKSHPGWCHASILDDRKEFISYLEALQLVGSENRYLAVSMMDRAVIYLRNNNGNGLSKKLYKELREGEKFIKGLVKNS